MYLGVPRGDTPGEGDGDGGPDGDRDRTGARGGTGGTPTAGTGVRPGNAYLRLGGHTENTLVISGHYLLCLIMFVNQTGSGPGGSTIGGVGPGGVAVGGTGGRGPALGAGGLPLGAGGIGGLKPGKSQLWSRVSFDVLS